MIFIGVLAIVVSLIQLGGMKSWSRFLAHIVAPLVKRSEEKAYLLVLNLGFASVGFVLGGGFVLLAGGLMGWGPDGG